MAGRYEFIQDVPNFQKVKVFVLTLLAIAFLVGVYQFAMSWVEGAGYEESFQAAKSFVASEIYRVTPLGLFFLGLFGGLFFIPLPLEFFFIAALNKGNPALLSLGLLLAGYLPSQLLDYFLGSRFNRLLMHFVSKKKLYRSKRWVNRFGPYAILVFNLLPLPSPMLTFALGIARYNPMRLFAFLLVGVLIKFFVLMLFIGWIF